MAEIVKGLFGINPQGYQEGQLAQQRAEAMQYSKLDPFQKATTAIYQGTQQGIGAGLNMMGVQDPELQAQQVAAQLANQFDLTTADGMAAYSQALGQKSQETGLPALSGFANMAGQKAMSMQATTADIGYKQALTDTSQNKLDLDRQYRAEMQAAIDAGASDEDKLNITLKYGGPDAQAVVTGRLLAAREKADNTQNKPLSASLQKSEDKDLEAIDNYKAQSDTLQPSIAALTQDEAGVRKLNLDPVNIAKYISRNALGQSTPESRAYAGLKSAVDTAVNLQVSAEKGVQTDKDVLRFANALIAAYGRNDSEATLEALKKYNASIETARINTEKRLESRRTQQGVAPYYGEGRDSTKSSAPLGTATNPIVLK